VSTRIIGAEGEIQAVKYLKKQGYKIVETNLVTHFGEIDIVANEKKNIVFIEVKLRRTKEFGLPADAVDKRKQSKIIKSALQYIKLKNLTGNNFRFDVLAIGPEPGKIELIKNAFSSDGQYTL
jgi:putative endonuclease